MFFKINENAIVNLNQIVWMDVDRVKLTDGSEHIVSADKLDDFLKLMKYSNKAVERLALGNF